MNNLHKYQLPNLINTWPFDVEYPQVVWEIVCLYKAV